MKQITYNTAIDVLSHLILTKPDLVTALLASYGTQFLESPTKRQLISAVLSHLQSEDIGFTRDLNTLVTTHVTHYGKQMMLLSESFSNYMDEDYDDFLSSIIKGAVGAIGGLLKKKKRRRGNGSGGGSSSPNTGAAQIAAVKKDMEARMQRMLDEQRREKEQQRLLFEKQRQADKEKADAAAKRASTTLYVVIGIAGAIIVGFIVMMTTKKSTPMPIYNANPQIPQAR